MGIEFGNNNTEPSKYHTIVTSANPAVDINEEVTELYDVVITKVQEYIPCATSEQINELVKDTIIDLHQVKKYIIERIKAG